MTGECHVTVYMYLHVILEVVDEEAHVCPQLPDEGEVLVASLVLHQQSPALLEGELCPPQAKEHVEQSIVPESAQSMHACTCGMAGTLTWRGQEA